VPAGVADEGVDAFLDRRVRREEIGEARARVVDTHLHEARRHALELVDLAAVGHPLDHLEFARRIVWQRHLAVAPDPGDLRIVRGTEGVETAVRA